MCSRHCVPPCLTCRTRQTSFSRLYELLTFRHDRRDDDDEYTHTIELREGLRIVFFNMVPDAIGSVAFLVGSVFASKASRDWRDVEICKNTDEGGSSREALPV